VPAICVEAPRPVLCERNVDSCGQCDVIVVVQVNQFAQLQMTCQRCGFRCDAFHHVAVAHYPVRKMIDDVEAVAVIARSQICFRHCHAHAVAEALTKRPRCHLDTRCDTTFRVTRRDTAPQPKLLELFERQVVAGEMKQAVQQRRTMSRREHKAIAVKPMRVGRMVLEQTRPQHVGHRCSAQGQSRMTAVCLLHRVDRQEAQCIDA